MPLFRDVRQFTRTPSYAVDIPWRTLNLYLQHEISQGLNIDPDFQRGYVWTPEQKIRYCEFILRGGSSGRDIHVNHPSWNMIRKFDPLSELDYVLVDGKQRISAVLGFMCNEFPIFGNNHFRDYEDEPRITVARFRWHVNDLKTYKEVLQWYLDLNSGGTAHTREDLDRVKKLLEREAKMGREDGTNNEP